MLALHKGMQSLPSGGSRQETEEEEKLEKEEKSRLGVLTIVCVSALPWYLLYNHQECHKSSAFISHLFHLLDPHPTPTGANVHFGTLLPSPGHTTVRSPRFPGHEDEHKG